MTCDDILPQIRKQPFPKKASVKGAPIVAVAVLVALKRVAKPLGLVWIRVGTVEGTCYHVWPKTLRVTVEVVSDPYVAHCFESGVRGLKVIPLEIGRVSEKRKGAVLEMKKANKDLALKSPEAGCAHAT
ncbi:MAG: hypothetical protein SW127_08015 [Actinomycetota bacterium]|nr:hypothetical protein [Actinomycetota bacterium]